MAHIILETNWLRVEEYQDENYISIVNTNGLQLLAISNVHRMVSPMAMAEIGLACADIIRKYPRKDLAQTQSQVKRPDPDVAKPTCCLKHQEMGSDDGGFCAGKPRPDPDVAKESKNG